MPCSKDPFLEKRNANYNERGCISAVHPPTESSFGDSRYVLLHQENCVREYMNPKMVEAENKGEREGSRCSYEKKKFCNPKSGRDHRLKAMMVWGARVSHGVRVEPCMLPLYKIFSFTIESWHA